MGDNTIIENKALKVLILEDMAPDMELMVEQLSDAGYRLDVSHADNEAGFRETLLNNKFDIILSDYKLPGFNAFGALEICQKFCPEVPFICVSGSIGEETAIELLKQGAVDYVLKDRPDRLPFTVKRALDEAKEKSAHLKTVKDLIVSETRFRQVAEAAQEFIWEVDHMGMYTYVSPIIESFLGYTPDEVVDKKYFYDFFAPENREEFKNAAFEVFLRKEVFRNFENTIKHKGGRLVIALSSGSPVFDDLGNFKGYRGVDKDITEERKMLEDLVAAKEKAEESDKLKSAFLNNISHEIRTPLNSIIGFGRILAETELSAQERREFYDYVNQSGNRLINTVTDYMDMARIVSNTMEVHKTDFVLLPLFEEITTITKLLCEKKNIDFLADLPPGSNHLTLNSDPEFIHKILGKLLDNAVKFTNEGTISCGYTIKSGLVEFFVKDTGCGIDIDNQKLIFDMFRQADTSMTRLFDGSGLGLSIAKGLATLLEGEIHVASEKGRGSEFTFTIPLSKSFSDTHPTG